MPRTATPRSNARQRTGKTSSHQQGTESQATPVLFRLPDIDLKSLITPIDDGPDEEAVSKAIAPASDSVEEGLASRTNKLGTADSPPQPNHFSTSVEPLVVSSTASSSDSLKTPAAKTHAQPAPVVSSFDERSWWEHWSSGVVLILLVIALVAASIMALNDRGDTDPHVLADNEIEVISMDTQIATGTAEFPTASVDNNNNAVPSIPSLAGSHAAPPTSPIVSGSDNKPESSADSLPPAAKIVESGKSSNPAAKPTDVTASATPTQAQPNPIPAPATQPGSSLMVNVPDSPLASVPVPPLADENNSSSTSAASLATGAPNAAGVPPAPHYPELSAPEAGGRLPAFLGTEPSVNQPNVAISSPKPSQQIVLFPELPPIDVSANQANQPLANQTHSSPPSKSGAATSQPKFTTQSPSYQQLLGNSSSSDTPNAVGGKFTTVSHASQSSAAAGANGQPTAGERETSAQSTGSQMARTPTPDMNAEALIQVWQEFRQLRQMETQPSNRYSTPSTEGQSP